MDATQRLSGVLHATVAFDWGEEIDLARAAVLFPAEQLTLPRRRRTPPSIEYQTPPLSIKLSSTHVSLNVIGDCSADAEISVFDFGAVAVTLRLPFDLTADQLTRLAAALAQPAALVEVARAAAHTVYERIRPAIKSPEWSDLSEEYFVFQLAPASLGSPFDAEQFVRDSAGWLAGLLRLEDAPLSSDEVNEATRLRLAYGKDDVVLVEWATAVVIDADCEDTLRTIEFANVQLLELRFLDRRVDQTLNHAYGLIHPLAKRRLPFWRLQTKPLRALGDMRIGTVVLFERTSSTLKLVGDQYLSRLYRMLSARFRLEEWSRSIQTSLDAAEGVYEVLAQQSATLRIEILEIIVVVLILFEIVMAFLS